MWKRLAFGLWSCSVLCIPRSAELPVAEYRSSRTNRKPQTSGTYGEILSFLRTKNHQSLPVTTMQTIPGAPQEWFLEFFRAFQSLIQPLECGRQAHEYSQGNGHNHVRMMRSSFLNSRNNALASRCRLSSAKYLILFFHHRPSFWLRHKASKLSIKTWFKKVRAHTGWINGSRAYIAAAVISQI